MLFFRGCSLCSTPPLCEQLPQTMRLTFNGLTNTIKSGPLMRASSPSVAAFLTGPGDTEGPATGIQVVHTLNSAQLARIEPSLVAINPTGRGATFTVTVRPITFQGRNLWEIDAVTFSGDGRGYQNNSPLVFLAADDVTECTESLADVFLNVTRAAPTLTAAVLPADPCNCSTPGILNGTGAQFAISYTQTSAVLGSELWAISGIAVLAGGSGYASGQQLSFSLGDADSQVTAATATISVTAGVVTGATITNGGAYYKGGVPSSINIVSRGRFYYRDTAQTQPPIVLPSSQEAQITALSTSGTSAPLDVTIGGVEPGGITRPVFSVGIDDDPDSETFGRVTSVALASGGSGLKAWETASSCFESLNGRTLTLRGETEQTVSLCLQSKYGFRTFSPVIPEDYDGLNTGLSVPAGMVGEFGFAYLARVEPVTTINAFGTSGVTYSFTWRPIVTSNKLPAWALDSVEATGGTMSISPVVAFAMPATSDDKYDGPTPAQVRVYKNRIEPVLQAATPCHAGGLEVQISYSLIESAPQVFGVSALAIKSGGSGYSGQVPITFSVAGGSGSTQDSPACAIGYANESGAIDRIRVLSAGRYWKEENTPGKVVVEDGGIHYRETKSLPPIYDEDTSVVVYQKPPSNGSGAEFSVDVDLDPNSATFGRITSLTATSPGSGYILTGKTTFAFFTECNPAGTSYMYLACELRINPFTCAPYVWVWGRRTDIPCDTSWSQVGSAYLLFADFENPATALSSSNRSVTLPAMLEGNAGTCTIEWGGVFDEDEKFCSCCDEDTSYCLEPCPVENPRETIAINQSDPLGLVWQSTCAGSNEDGDILENEENGGPQQWRPVWNEAGEFVEWQFICGECTQAVFRGYDENFEPIYATQWPPNTSLPSVPRDRRGITNCFCPPEINTPRGCYWDIEIGDDGCWTGNYILQENLCENPLP